MASTSAGSPSLKPSTAIKHGPDCDLHKSPLSSQCNATTIRKLPCRRAPDRSRLSPDRLPVCKQHKDTQLPAGKCQAIAECGRHCDRLAEYDPPFHFCAEHASGTETLPCHLLQLPAELRDMIWQYVLPDTVSATGFAHDRNTFSLFRVNQQISTEALSVVYEQVPFEVHINATVIWACREALLYSPKLYPEVNNRNLFDFDMDTTPAAHLLPPLKRIRNFSIKIELAPDMYRPACVDLSSHRQAISPQDYDIFQIRDKLKKFVEVIHRYGSPNAKERSGSTRFRGLELRLSLGEDYSWTFDEVLAMVIMVAEPFKAVGGVQQPVLHNILFLKDSPARPESNLDRFNAEYQAYKSEWQAAMSQSPLPAYRDPMGPSRSVIDRSKKELRDIEEFVTYLHNQSIARFDYDLPSAWSTPDVRPFSNIARVVHLARVASEQYDMANLAAIRDVLLKRWIDYQEMQKQEASVVSKSLLSLFNGSKKSEAFLMHEEKLTVTEREPRQIAFDRNWPELDLHKFVTNRASPVLNEGITYTEDRQHRFFHKNGKYLGSALKTPSFIRINRGGTSM